MRVAYLDELYSQAEIQSVCQFMGTIESKDLLVVKGKRIPIYVIDLCKNNEYSRAETIANDSKSSAVFSYLAENYLGKADLLKARHAFIKSSDYRGVQLMKKLDKISV